MSDLGSGCLLLTQPERCVCVSIIPYQPFPLRQQDGLELNHWQREADQGKPYPYAKFNKSLDIPSYTEEEYKVRSVGDCYVGLADCCVWVLAELSL